MPTDPELVQHIDCPPWELSKSEGYLIVTRPASDGRRRIPVMRLGRVSEATPHKLGIAHLLAAAPELRRRLYQAHETMEATSAIRRVPPNIRRWLRREVAASEVALRKACCVDMPGPTAAEEENSDAAIWWKSHNISEQFDLLRNASRTLGKSLMDVSPRDAWRIAEATVALPY